MLKMRDIPRGERPIDPACDGGGPGRVGNLLALLGFARGEMEPTPKKWSQIVQHLMHAYTPLHSTTLGALCPGR